MPLSRRDIQRLADEFVNASAKLHNTAGALDEITALAKSQENQFIAELKGLSKKIRMREEISGENGRSAQRKGLKDVSAASESAWQMAADFVEDVMERISPGHPKHLTLALNSSAPSQVSSVPVQFKLRMEAKEDGYYYEGRRVSNFTLSPVKMIDGATGKIRIVRLNSKEAPSKEINLTAEVFAMATKFRSFMLNQGNYGWFGGQRDLEHLQVDLSQLFLNL